jgi:RNA-directed DNA polymerase
MTDKRQKRMKQMTLPFATGGRGEAPHPVTRVESVTVSHGTERPAEGGGEEKALMEEVVSGENLSEAVKRVISNRGSPGVDGMTVWELRAHMKSNWSRIREQLLEGTYKPQPVKRVEIPKPGGGTRNLGVPTVVDRVIQQAILQVLQKRLDPGFSDHSYGFRPGRSAHQAIERAQGYIQEGYHWVVDIDLERFFDRVNHDILMALLAKQVKDKRVLKVTRAFLNSGVMDDGLVSPTTGGTPQGGPLSPLLSNVMLTVLDRELEKRGHRFVRYADDCNIYVRSERAGQRVMEGITRFLGRKLKLKVNPMKSAVDMVSRRKFLGFTFTTGDRVKRRIAPQSIARFKHKVRRLTRRTPGKSLGAVIKALSAYLNGWKVYFGFCETSSVLERLDSWIRRRLRALLWKQWKTRKNRFKSLKRLGVSKAASRQAAGSRKYWRISRSKAIHIALSREFFKAWGLTNLARE